MKLSEPITIYLAAGASFGVSRYFRAESRSSSRSRALMEGVIAALLWPLLATAILLKRLRHTDENRATADPDSRVEEAERAMVASVNKMLETARRAKREEVEQTLYALREGVEQYAGLARAEACADPGAAPAAYEMELARISGRRGDDLMLAGRCVHRRNVNRLKAHYERERSRLLGKLAELRGQEDVHAEALPYSSHSTERQKMSEARLEIYGRAADLFSLLEDESGARSVRRLLEAEFHCLQGHGEASAQAKDTRSFGDEICTEQASQTIYRHHPKATTFTQG